MRAVSLFGLLLPSIAWAEPAVDSLELGATAAVVEQVLGRVEWLDAGTPQAYRRGLIDSGMLEALNVASAAPTTRDGRFDFSPFQRIGLAKKGDRAYVAVLSKTGLRFMFVVRAVPVDATKDPGGGWSKARLHRLKNALAELAPYRLREAGRDRWGNTFHWRGKKGRARLAVRYQPGDDRLEVLMY